jgi:chromosome segregation ATPase
MITLANIVRTTVVIGAVLLGGCSTPQPILDQANNGAHLITSMQAQIDQFRANSKAIGQAQTDSLRVARKQLAKTDSITADDDRIITAAGVRDFSEQLSKLLALLDARVADEKALSEKLAQIDKTMDELVKPLTDPTKDIAAAQQAMATLGNELPLEDRLRTLWSFAKDIKTALDENAQKIEDAKKARKTDGKTDDGTTE